jgi:light-regulated signal transduction histidine kinase (bacteriophytochrome)
MQTLHDHAARQLRRVLGFDRVMVYRFDTDGSGEVVGEAAATHLESFRGLRYPATDIPVQARALYCRNWLRLIADVGAATQAILPLPAPGHQPLDLSSNCSVNSTRYRSKTASAPMLRVTMPLRAR